MDENWYLDGYIEGEHLPRRISIHASPFRIGRKSRSDIHCSIPSKSLSGLHAELRVIDDSLWIRDRDSSNGTFVNRIRIDGPTLVHEGDVIHLAKHEFLVVRKVKAREHEVDDDNRTQINSISITQLPRRSVAGVAEFRELISTAAVAAVFQPIVSVATSTPQYFELLGRGTHPGVSAAPNDLFRIAAELGEEARLSRLFEQAGFRDMLTLPAPCGIFINLHPTELQGDQSELLLDFLAAQRASTPDVKMVVEIHESAVLVREQMQQLSARLQELDIKLAYDDFGAGQARLLELIEVPCEYLKFDRSLICDIDKAPRTRHMLLDSLIRIAVELGITCLAEGVETAAEWATCRQLGFTHAQGYYFGHPEPAAYWSRERLAQMSTAVPGSHTTA